MKGKRLAGAIALVSVGVTMGFALGTRRQIPSPKRDSEGRILGHYQNNNLAKEIKPGMALSKVIDKLGDPVAQRDGWLEFMSSPNGARPRVKLGAIGLVAEVDSGNDEY